MNTRTHAPDTAGPGPAAAGLAIDELWHRWDDARDAADRERLILHYAPLVKYVASRLSVGVSATVDGGDLISYGMFGLIDAIERFDVTRGVRFEGYAIPRIKGAIVDELRATDWVPRAVRDHARAVQRAVADLEAALRRTPTDAELADHLDIDVERLHQVLDQVSLTSLIALDELFVHDDGERRTLGDTLHDTTAVDPQGRVERVEQRVVLRAAIERLDERDRAVIVLYYLEGMTLSQIGEILRVSESRVSQLHTRAVLALRAKLSVPAV
ncbi:MAG: FliA/WhiG family RNA polymerase sigma factor [Actinobacteria bacterium]|nr:FliA/WhiG family RNA polymerase sigma factor [Actinomycetota bacterium]